MKFKMWIAAHIKKKGKSFPVVPLLSKPDTASLSFDHTRDVGPVTKIEHSKHRV